MLVLFDVDKTLFLNSDPLMGQATTDAIKTVWGLKVPGDAIRGVAEFFPPGQGAFGCDAEERAELIDIARRRAGDWPRERTVAVGDTAADVAGARAAGIHVIGFGPDPALAEADAVIERMDELPVALERLSAAT